MNVDESKDVLEFSKKDAQRLFEKSVEATYASPEVNMTVKNAPKLNFSQVNMENVRNLHAESISADPETYRANWRAIEAREARLERLKNGKGNLSDLAATRNALQG